MKAIILFACIMLIASIAAHPKIEEFSTEEKGALAYNLTSSTSKSGSPVSTLPPSNWFMSRMITSTVKTSLATTPLTALLNSTMWHKKLPISTLLNMSSPTISPTVTSKFLSSLDTSTKTSPPTTIPKSTKATPSPTSTPSLSSPLTMIPDILITSISPSILIGQGTPSSLFPKMFLNRTYDLNLNTITTTEPSSSSAHEKPLSNSAGEIKTKYVTNEGKSTFTSSPVFTGTYDSKTKSIQSHSEAQDSPFDHQMKTSPTVQFVSTSTNSENLSKENVQRSTTTYSTNGLMSDHVPLKSPFQNGKSRYMETYDALSEFLVTHPHELPKASEGFQLYLPIPGTSALRINRGKNLYNRDLRIPREERVNLSSENDLSPLTSPAINPPPKAPNSYRMDQSKFYVISTNKHIPPSKKENHSSKEFPTIYTMIPLPSPPQSNNPLLNTFKKRQLANEHYGNYDKGTLEEKWINDSLMKLHDFFSKWKNESLQQIEGVAMYNLNSPENTADNKHIGVNKLNVKKRKVFLGILGEYRDPYDNVGEEEMGEYENRL